MPLPRFLRRLLWIWGFFGILLLLVFAAGVFVPGAPVEPEGTVILLQEPGGPAHILAVDRATTPDERRRGLQNRPTVDRGMLFVFPAEETLSFWMKDTLVPLDIAYFRSNGTWVSSHRMEPCTADPCRTFPSADPARYALELPLGEIGPRIGTGWVLDVR